MIFWPAKGIKNRKRYISLKKLIFIHLQYISITILKIIILFDLHKIFKT